MNLNSKPGDVNLVLSPSTQLCCQRPWASQSFSGSMTQLPSSSPISKAPLSGPTKPAPVTPSGFELKLQQRSWGQERRASGLSQGRKGEAWESL